MGESVPFHTAHVFETVLEGTLGAEGWKGLWTGATPFTDPGITDSLNTLDRLIGFANPDYLSIDSVGATDLVIAGRVFGIINGDWTNGYLKSKKFADFGYSPAMQTQGHYSALADSVRPADWCRRPDNAVAWLKVCGSLAGQDAFNPLKGSIPARLDGGQTTTYDAYQRSAMADWRSDVIIPSVVHGFAAKQSFVTDFVNIMNTFAVNATSRRPRRVWFRPLRSQGLPEVGLQSVTGDDLVVPRSLAAPAKRRSVRAFVKSDTFWACVVITPSVLAVLIFIYAFIVWTFYISVINWNDVVPDLTFVGLQNFVRLFQTPRFITDLHNTAVFSIFFVGQCLGIGLLLAILLDQKIKGEAFFRTVYVLPFAVSAIVTGVAWKWLMVPSSGINAIFGAVD